MISKEVFYSSYLDDYNSYKLMMFTSIWNNIDNFENGFFSQQNGYKRDDFKLVLKTEIRQTYYHTIETLFELIFALLPDANGFYDDILQIRLSNSNWRKNYKIIENIAENGDCNNIFDPKIRISDKFEITKGHYLFYFGLHYENKKIQKELLEAIPLSLEIIKKGICFLAKDFTNRDEYNSYKHGLRFVPAIEKLMVLEKDFSKKYFDLDFKDSITYLTVDSKTDSLSYTTRISDTWRDIELSKFALGLISNIIALRRASFKIGDEQVPIYTFPEDNFNNISKTNELKEFTYTIKKKKLN